jgi:hypothetical protein
MGAGGAGGAHAGWRPIDELAALVGVYCWVERRIFEVTGGWATGPAGTDGVAPELRVFWAAASRRHGVLAGRWAERLPVRAGVDPAALVAPPAGPLAGALEALASEPDPGARADALVGAVLPLLAEVYGAHLRSASPVSEGPVMEVLVEARRESAAEIRGGTAVLGALSQGSDVSAGLRAGIEQAFEGTRVFPAVCTS